MRQARGGGGMGSDPTKPNAFGSVKAKGRNSHPTCKPIKLMSWLITLGSREGDIVLDPFAGSFTTCIAAKLLRRNYIGIEREQEYKEIADARIKAWEPEPMQRELAL